MHQIEMPNHYKKTSESEGLLICKFNMVQQTNLLAEQAIELQHDTAFAELVDALGLRWDLIISFEYCLDS